MPHLTRQQHLIRVRELRAKLREVLDDDEPRIVGGPWDPRAFILTLGNYGALRTGDIRHAVAKVRRDLTELILCLEGD